MFAIKFTSKIENVRRKKLKLFYVFAFVKWNNNNNDNKETFIKTTKKNLLQ